MTNTTPQPGLNHEQNGRLSAAMALLNTAWGAMQNINYSHKGLAGFFRNVPGPVTTILANAKASIASNVLTPQKRGAVADQHIVTGELQPGVQFFSKIVPGIQPNTFNIEIELFPTLTLADRDTQVAESVFKVCEELLDAELGDPGQFGVFVRRQLERSAGENRRREMGMQLAEIVTDEMRRLVK